jgi:hypothetical protein
LRRPHKLSVSQFLAILVRSLTQSQVATGDALSLSMNRSVSPSRAIHVFSNFNCRFGLAISFPTLNQLVSQFLHGSEPFPDIYYSLRWFYVCLLCSLGQSPSSALAHYKRYTVSNFSFRFRLVISFPTLNQLVNRFCTVLSFLLTLLTSIAACDGFMRCPLSSIGQSPSPALAHLSNSNRRLTTRYFATTCDVFVTSFDGQLAILRRSTLTDSFAGATDAFTISFYCGRSVNQDNSSETFH